MTYCEFEQFGCTFGAFWFYSKMATVSQMDENMELAFAFAAPSQMFLSLLLLWCQHSLGAPLRSVPIDPPMSVSHPQWTHSDKWFPKIQSHRALVMLKPIVSNQHVGRVMALLSLKSAETQNRHSMRGEKVEPSETRLDGIWWWAAGSRQPTHASGALKAFQAPTYSSGPSRCAVPRKHQQFHQKQFLQKFPQ